MVNSEERQNISGRALPRRCVARENRHGLHHRHEIEADDRLCHRFSGSIPFPARDHRICELTDSFHAHSHGVSGAQE